MQKVQGRKVVGIRLDSHLSIIEKPYRLLTHNSNKRLPDSVRVYFCLELVGLSGLVIVSIPFSIKGNIILRLTSLVFPILRLCAIAFAVNSDSFNRQSKSMVAITNFGTISLSLVFFHTWTNNCPSNCPSRPLSHTTL